MSKNKKHDKETYDPVFKQTWDFFASVHLAITVLILIAATSIIGTIIPQNAPDSFYVQKYGESLHKLFLVLDFYNMYQAWWFLLLLLLLVINIIVCSIDRLKKTWKIIFPKTITFNPDRFRKLKTNKTFKIQGDYEKTVAQFKKYLSGRFKTIIEKREDNFTALYVEKGRWARSGVYIVHISIILLLIGALAGAIFGFKGHINLAEGEAADTVPFDNNKTEKQFGFTVKCNSFLVKFYDTGAPEEYKTNISIFENNKEVLNRDIIVNDPLRYKKINFFQSSYGVDSADNLVLKIESRDSKMFYTENIKINQTINIPENGGKFTLVRYLPRFSFKGHNIGESFIGTIKKPDGKEFMVVLPVKFSTFDKMRGGDFIFVADKYTKKYYTVLQVTYDPGVIYVYAGFIFMIAGCFITFFISHQSIMVQITETRNNDLDVLVCGKANRNNQSMKLTMEKLTEKLSGLQINKRKK